MTETSDCKKKERKKSLLLYSMLIKIVLLKMECNVAREKNVSFL